MDKNGGQHEDVFIAGIYILLFYLFILLYFLGCCCIKRFFRKRDQAYDLIREAVHRQEMLEDEEEGIEAPNVKPTMIKNENHHDSSPDNDPIVVVDGNQPSSSVNCSESEECINEHDTEHDLITL